MVVIKLSILPLLAYMRDYCTGTGTSLRMRIP